VAIENGKKTIAAFKKKEDTFGKTGWSSLT